MSLQDIVNVKITRETKSITRAGFGTALILGASATFGEAARVYSNIKGVAVDFATGTSEYKAANALFGQDQAPKSVIIGKRGAIVAQVSTFTVLNNTPANFTVTINGLDHTFVATNQTIAAIATGLVALINAGAQAVNVTAATGGPAGSVVVTADVPGTGFSAVATTANISVASTTPNHGVVEDIQTVQALNDTWYALILTSRAAADILNAASWTQSQRRIYLACTDSSDVIAAPTTDVFSTLKAKAYDRTIPLYSADQADYPEAGWAGGMLPYDPGSATWKFKTIAGATPDDTLSASAETNLVAKNVNYYKTVAGVPITQPGKVASGEWADVIVFQDWLQAQIEEAVFGRLVSVPKLPYTDSGVAVIEGDIRACGQRGERAGGLAPGSFYVDAPKVADIATGDRQDRFLPDINFGGTLAGAIHSADMTGRLSV